MPNYRKQVYALDDETVNEIFILTGVHGQIDRSGEKGRRGEREKVDGEMPRRGEREKGKRGDGECGTRRRGDGETFLVAERPIEFSRGS